jgi:dienelactone hydrolase
MKLCMAWLMPLVLVFLASDPGIASEDEAGWRPDWLAVSDPVELDRTWSDALVFLPPELGLEFGRLLNNDGNIAAIANTPDSCRQWPTILYLHSCEGLGAHREDLRRYAQLGFVVIAPNSFARAHRPLGCYEERELFIRYFDIAAAFQKAELDYAVARLAEFSWIDRSNLFLIGSGMGGMVAAQYQGADFAGHVIEGWGCRGPNPIFDGIWAPPGVRIYSAVSRNDPWFQNNEGFSVDCETFVADRPDSIAVILERPAHYVSWYPKSRPSLIRFLTRDMDVDTDSLVIDVPVVVSQTPNTIVLREKWSDEAVYDAARQHCAQTGKSGHLIAEPVDRLYSFVCE